MIVDTSALLAVLLKEPDASFYFSKIQSTEVKKMSAASYLEACTVARMRVGSQGPVEVSNLVEQLEITIVPFTETQARLAAQAFSTYGKGIHPAKLNFGDCFPMPWRGIWRSPCFSKARISPRQILLPPQPDALVASESLRATN